MVVIQPSKVLVVVDDDDTRAMILLVAEIKPSFFCLLRPIMQTNTIICHSLYQSNGDYMIHSLKTIHDYFWVPPEKRATAELFNRFLPAVAVLKTGQTFQVQIS
jgi:hypothetical protein